MSNCAKSCEKECSKYDNLPLTEKTLHGMSLNVDDLKAIKLMFCKQDQALEEMIKKRENELIGQLAQVLQEQFNSLHISISLIAKDIQSIQTEVKTIKKDIGTINRRLDKNNKRMEDFERRLRILERKALGTTKPARAVKKSTP